MESVIIIGLSLGLYGYDNNFAAPLMQLPLFIVKYQGPAISFTVSIANLLLYQINNCDIANSPIYLYRPGISTFS